MNNLNPFAVREPLDQGGYHDLSQHPYNDVLELLLNSQLDQIQASFFALRRETLNPAAALSSSSLHRGRYIRTFTLSFFAN